MTLSEELKQFSENAKKEMEQLYEKVKQHPLTCLICIIVIITAVVLLIALPYWRVTQFGITDPKDLAEMENSFRATLAQILGGVAVGIGIYFAWGNLTTAREGQITERFTRAIDQLGSKELEIRLGGIYALERISEESNKDYWPIMKILTAYVRKNSSVENQIKENSSLTESVSIDIQAIFHIIKKCRLPRGLDNFLDLSKTNLQKVNFDKAHLEGANLERANLFSANLTRTNLFSANLTRANLKDAKLIGTDLRGANLTEVDLKNFGLEGFDLTGADLTGAKLEGAKLIGTKLIWAILEEAKLIGANLIKADLEKADLTGADLTGANLSGARFRESKLKGAENLTFEQLSKAKTLYKAELDEGLEAELRAKGFGHLLDEEPDDEP